MDVKELCTGLSAELSGWKARMYGIIGHVETLPVLDRSYFSPDVNALRAIISEIEDTMRQLARECPSVR
jgi:hypothetical protein